MSEKFYDEEIAPKLLKIAEICKAKGTPFLAIVEYETGELASTATQIEDESLKMIMIRHCLKTAPNIDSYVMGLSRYAEEKKIDTSGSIVMSRLKN